MITNAKIFTGMVYTTAALVAVLVAGYIYSRFFEVPYLTYKNVPFTVTGTAIPGGPASAPVIRCSSSDTTEAYTTTRNFQKMGANQAAVVLPSVDVTVEPGCEPAISRINIVPDGTLPGYYRFYGVATVQGLFITHKVAWGTAFFEVIAKPPTPVAAAPGAVVAPLLLPIENAVVKIEVQK